MKNVIGIYITAIASLIFVMTGCADYTREDNSVDNGTDDTYYVIEMVDSEGVIIFCLENNLTDCIYEDGSQVDDNTNNSDYIVNPNGDSNNTDN